MYTKTHKAIFRLFNALLLVVLATVFLTSCISSDDGTSASSNTCHITNVSFNSFRRLTTAKASDGVTDSTFYTTYTASNWVFTINHKTLRIENRDSLPCNTDLSRVVMSLSYNGGIAYHRASDAWEDDPWVSYDSSDSIDLRKPLHIRIVATDNTERKYTLKVNVHTVESDSLKWVAMKSNDAISGQHAMKATSLNEKVAVLVNDGNAVAWMSHDRSDLGEWNRHITDLPLETDVLSLAKGQKNVFVNTTDGALYSSQDGVAWTKLYQYDGLRLVGVSNDKLYAIFNGALHSIYIGAEGWKEEPLDDDFAFMPDMEIADITYAQTSTLTRMLIIGNRSAEADTTAMVWSKCWTDFEDEDTENWMFYTHTWGNSAAMPMLTQMNLIHYDGMLMIIGGESKDGTIKPMERFFASHDNGLTWWRLQSLLPPSDMQGAGGYITATVDKDNFIWLIAGNKVYRGRINRLGFDRPDIY